MSKLQKKKKKKFPPRTITSPNGNSLTLIKMKSRSQSNILQLRNILHLPRKDFARLVRSSERTLASIEAGKKPSPKTIRNLIELQRLINALSEVIDAESIGDWILQPSISFNGLKPMEVIEHGESDRIWEMIFYLRSGFPG